MFPGDPNRDPVEVFPHVPSAPATGPALIGLAAVDTVVAERPVGDLASRLILSELPHVGLRGELGKPNGAPVAVDESQELEPESEPWIRYERRSGGCQWSSTWCSWRIHIPPNPTACRC